jgi:hypothetical protein
MPNPKMFSKDGWQGIWRPERKMIDIYRLEDDRADLKDELSIKVKSEKRAKEYFDALQE